MADDIGSGTVVVLVEESGLERIVYTAEQGRIYRRNEQIIPNLKAKRQIVVKLIFSCL